MIRAVAFDAHGTMIAPNGPIGVAYARIAGDLGITADVATLEAAFRPAFKRVHAQWSVPYGADEADARAYWGAVIAGTFGRDDLPTALVDACFDAFAEPAAWSVLPGVVDALALLDARQVPRVVVSNFDGRLIGLLDGLGLTGFHRVWISSLVGAAKPDPSMHQRALDDLALQPDELLHIGDNANEDGGACFAAGCPFLHVEPGRGIDIATLTAWLETP